MSEKKSKKTPGVSAKTDCEDRHCPFHGNIRLHGRTFVGIVTKKNPNKTVRVEWPRTVYIKKYERYAPSRTRIKVHNPPCIDSQVGDTVKIVETRPISKTKHFVVVEVQK